MLNSFSLVGTHELKEECLLCIMSIRRLYPDTPVLLFTDNETREYLDDKVENVVFDPFCEPNNLNALMEQYSSVSVANRFHRVDCIAAKMYCVKKAVELFGDTMFIDSDIVFLDKIDEDLRSDVVLSPHYHGDNRTGQCDKYGVYNAGYVYTDNINTGDVWDTIYKERSSFFEQQGMIHFHEYMDTYNFDRTHNIGFWRCRVYHKTFPVHNGPYIDVPDGLFDGAKSLHVHMTKFYEARADSGLTAVYDQWMEACDTVIRERADGLIKEWDKLK